MTVFLIEAPFPSFSDANGRALDNGKIWIGVVDQNPKQYPQPVFWDEALTIPAVQPIRTSGGYPVRDGTPSRIYCDDIFSITVENRQGGLVYSALNGTTTDVVNTGWGGQTFTADGREGPYPLDYITPDPRAMALVLDGVWQEYETDYGFVIMPSAPSGYGVQIVGYPAPADPIRIRVLFTADVAGTGASINGDIAQFATRQALVDFMAAGGVVFPGFAVMAAGLTYIGQALATELPGLPGLVPVDPVAGHYGADPTGATSSTSALVAAVAAASGGHVGIDTGLYTATQIALPADGSIVGAGSQIATIKRTGTGNLINAANVDGARISGVTLNNDRATMGDVGGHGISATGKDLVFHDLTITDYGSAAGGGGGTGLLVAPGASGIPERIRISDVVLTPDLGGVITVGWILADAQISLVSRVISEGVDGGIGYAHELKNDAKYNSLNQLIARASNVALAYGQESVGVDGCDYNVATNIVSAACDTGLLIGEGIGNVTLGMVHDATGAANNGSQWGVAFSGGASKNYAGGVATFGSLDQTVYISGEGNFAEVAAHDTAADVARFTSGSARNVVQIAHPGARNSIRDVLIDESGYALSSVDANVVRSDATGERIGSIGGRFWDKLGEAGITPPSTHPWVSEHEQYAIHGLITAGNVGDISGLAVSTGRDGENTAQLVHVTGATEADNYWRIGAGGDVDAFRVMASGARVPAGHTITVEGATGNSTIGVVTTAGGLSLAASSGADVVSQIDFSFPDVSTALPLYRFGRATSSTAGGRLVFYRHDNTATEVVRIDALTGMAVNIGQLTVPQGTVAAPGVTFVSDQNTGIYWISDGQIGVSTNNSRRMTINSTGTFLTPPGAYANDAGAAAGGVAIGELYRVTGGTLAWRQV